MVCSNLNPQTVHHMTRGPVTNFYWDFWNYICIIPTITFLPQSTRMSVIPDWSLTGQWQGKWDRRLSVLTSPGFYWKVTMQRHFCKKGNSLSTHYKCYDHSTEKGGQLEAWRFTSILCIWDCQRSISQSILCDAKCSRWPFVGVQSQVLWQETNVSSLKY